jgi:predicted Ser/Thr protein kinase
MTLLAKLEIVSSFQEKAKLKVLILQITKGIKRRNKSNNFPKSCKKKTLIKTPATFISKNNNSKWRKTKKDLNVEQQRLKKVKVGYAVKKTLKTSNLKDNCTKITFVTITW